MTIMRGSVAACSRVDSALLCMALAYLPGALVVAGGDAWHVSLQVGPVLQHTWS